MSTINVQRRRLSRHHCRIARRLTIWYAGRDVTRVCFYLDRRRRVARVYTLDERGKHVLDTSRASLAWHELRGRRLTWSRPRP